jgi:hypothetical protein
MHVVGLSLFPDARFALVDAYSFWRIRPGPPEGLDGLVGGRGRFVSGLD